MDTQKQAMAAQAAYPPVTDWDIKGYYGQIVSVQANKQGIPAFDGLWDIYDITAPMSPRKVTGNVGAIGMRYALYYVANYGMFAHTYRIEARADVRHRAYVISL